MRTPSLSVTSETSSSHSSPHTESCLATSFLSRPTLEISGYHMEIGDTSSMLLIRPFSILIRVVSLLANSGAKAPAVPLRKLNPMDEFPKNLPLVDEGGGGGV
jgi:hypothetical protein